MHCAQRGDALRSRRMVAQRERLARAEYYVELLVGVLLASRTPKATIAGMCPSVVTGCLDCNDHLNLKGRSASRLTAQPWFIMLHALLRASQLVPAHRRVLSSIIAGRFAQSPTKEDSARYRRSLEQSSKKWLRQLESMGLPESIMRDAREEAPQLVESKLTARTAFTWA